MESLSDSEEYYSVASYDNEEDDEEKLEEMPEGFEEEEISFKKIENGSNLNQDSIKIGEKEKRLSKEMMIKKHPLPIPPKPMKFSPHFSQSTSSISISSSSSSISPSLIPMRGSSHDPTTVSSDRNDSIGFRDKSLGGTEKREENVEEEVEFVIKNLDTMESFSSKKMDQLIPKAIDPKHIDPIAKNIQKRDLASGKEEKEEEEKPRKSSKRKGISQRSRKKKMFAQALYQSTQAHDGPIWSLRFSYDGSLLATGGRDGILKIWKVTESENYFHKTEPMRVLNGHGGDILCINWSNSRSNLILTASTDCTVRLWTPNSNVGVVFQLEDIATCCCFHPKNEEIFIVGGLDCIIYVWNIPEKRILRAITASSFVTAISFDSTGEQIWFGGSDGWINVLESQELKFIRRILMKTGTFGKKGKKITGIEMMPDGKQILISSNSSVILQMDTVNFNQVCKYRAHKNEHSTLFATSSEKMNFIICGSEDNSLYLWDTSFLQTSNGIFSLQKRTHDSIESGSSPLTCAIFAPVERRITNLKECQMIVTTTTLGELKVFELKNIQNL